MTEETSAPNPDEGDAFETEGHAVLFGFPPSTVQLRIIRRSRGWRVGGAARTFGVSVVLAPVVALLPPHAIWPIGALITGAVLSRRRLKERFTLVSLEGGCPKCAKPLEVRRGRLLFPHPLPCEGCHHQGSLKLDEGTLSAMTSD